MAQLCLRRISGYDWRRLPANHAILLLALETLTQNLLGGLFAASAGGRQQDQFRA